MQPVSLLEIAHHRLEQILCPGDVAIDATLGNGHDALFLAQRVGEQGSVYGFDIQVQAIAATQARLAQYPQHKVTLFNVCHAQMLRLLPESLKGQIKAVMFNLGYLPGGDKTLITQSHTTLAALNAAGKFLAERGMMTVLAYPGHQGGDQEVQALSDWLERQPDYQVELIHSQHPRPYAPRLFVIRKRSHLL